MLSERDIENLEWAKRFMNAYEKKRIFKEIEEKSRKITEDLEKS